MGNTYTTNTTKRITSIDSLRAFALFGILMVHVRSGMGSGTMCDNPTFFDTLLSYLIYFIFQGRCALIFNVLFGVSFFIILRKPNYGSFKFVWRCFLLFVIGLVNQYFYNSDALMWYGLCGMLLVAFRRCSNKQLVVAIILLYIGSFMLQSLNLGDKLNDSLPPFTRYSSSSTERDFLLSYPYGILRYFSGVLNSGVLRTIANFIFGYFLGRIGFVDKWDELINSRYVLISLLIYIVLYVMKILTGGGISLIINMLDVFANISGAAFYTFAFIWIYNRASIIHPFLRWLENYGKCGLTNYSMQGIIGNIIFFHLGLSWCDCHFSLILVSAIVFYLIQCLFCEIWLRHFKNGPMEYLWRCATERRVLQFKIK